jgi:lysozyme
METSLQGIADLELEEGVVLRAYRDVVGVWTIGAGLTAASGVVKPKAGMVISKAEAARLTQLALRRNYEPGVLKAMGRPRQHEFDAGVSFHWNTGAIGRASWVKNWVNIGKKRGAAWDDVRRAFLAWNKGGGKVIPGLTNRRKREFAMLKDGVYRRATKAVPATPSAGLARFVLPIELPEIVKVRDALAKLGYRAGHYQAAIAEVAVRDFQRDHGLTEDGIIGKATLSTLQRMLNARANVAPAAAIPAASAASIASGADAALSGIPYIGEAVLGLSLIAALYLAFTYRDAIAAAVQRPMPRLAALLRRF